MSSESPPFRSGFPGIPTVGLAWVIALAGGAAEGCSCDESGPPSECSSREDCGEGELCTQDGRCVAGAECTTDDACTDDDPRKACDLTTLSCVFREGFADECAETRPCAFGQFCSTLLGRCLDAASSRDCTRRSQCPSGQICDREANKCIADLGCYGDAFCEDGEICDLVNHVCRSVSVECTSCILNDRCPGNALCSTDTKECLAGAEPPRCRAGEKCDPLGRCVQCTSSEECGPGLFCNVALGRCESNVQCAPDPSLCPDSPDVQCVMCVPPEVCDPRTKKCQAPAAVCAGDVDCPGDQFCDLGRDPPICAPRIPSCLNDLFDDPRNNDRFPDASTLPESAGPIYDDLKLCPGDTDWYRIDVASGTFLTIDARFEHEDGDIELQLFLPDGRTLIDESRTVTDNERVDLEVGTDRTFLLRVFLAIPTSRPVSYRLVVTRDAGALCPDDENEPDDSPGDAKPLASDMPVAGRVCSADPDWFVLRAVPPGTRIRTTLEFTDNLGDLDLELHRAGARTPLLVSSALSDGEEIVYDASYGGDFFLRVVAKGRDTNVYVIRADLRPNPQAACLDDAFEPNDLPSESTNADTILGAIVPNLSICAGDEDWYEIELGPGEAVTAEAGFDPSADIELRLYPSGTTDPNVTPLRTSSGLSLREFLAYRSTGADRYLLRVHGHDRAQISPYELRLRREPPFICTPDAIDAQGRGTNMMDAFDLSLPPTRMDDLTICTGDEDWFRLFVVAGFTNVVRLHYVGNDAQINFAFLDAMGNQLAATQGAGTDVKEISVNVNGDGVAEVFLRVFLSMGLDVGYSLTVDLVPIFDCFDDFAEPNDTPLLASLVASSTVTPIELRNLHLCANLVNPTTGLGDEDWYVLMPPAAGARIDASIEHAQGDLFLELLSPGATRRACINAGNDRCYSDGLDLTEQVAFTATVAEPYFLRVGSFYSSPTIPFRPADIDTPYTLRLQYTLE